MNKRKDLGNLCLQGTAQGLGDCVVSPNLCSAGCCTAGSFCTSSACTVLLPLEECVLSCSACWAYAVGAAGPERGRMRINLLSWPAGMDVPVEIKALIPGEQLYVLHEITVQSVFGSPPLRPFCAKGRL